MMRHKCIINHYYMYLFNPFPAVRLLCLTAVAKAKLMADSHCRDCRSTSAPLSRSSLAVPYFEFLLACISGDSPFLSCRSILAPLFSSSLAVPVLPLALASMESGLVLVVLFVCPGAVFQQQLGHLSVTFETCKHQCGLPIFILFVQKLLHVIIRGFSCLYRFFPLETDLLNLPLYLPDYHQRHFWLV